MRRSGPAIALTVALAAWYLTPWPWLAALWALCYATLAWRWPRWALALLPLTFPFWYAPLHVTSRLTFPLSEAALTIVTAVTLAQFGWRLARLTGEKRWRYLNGWPRVFLRQTGWLVPLGAGLLLLGMTIGVIIAREPHDALRAWRWEIAEPLVFAALVIWRLRVRWVWRMVWAFIASGVIVAALAIAQATFAHVTVAALGNGGGLVHYPIPNLLGKRWWRSTAIIYGSPNSLGTWVMLALPLAFVRMYAPYVGRLERWFALGAMCLLLAGLVLSGSRGAFVSLVVAILVGFLAVFRRFDVLPPHRQIWPEGKRAGKCVIALAFVAAILYGGSVLWLAPLVRVAEHSAPVVPDEVRLLVWQSGLAMAQDHPLLGVGPDQFLYYYDPQFTNHPFIIATQNGHPTAAASEPNLSHPHNLGLELWLSAGLMGLFGIMLVVIAALAKGWAALASGNIEPFSGLMAALLVGLAHGLVDSAYFQPDLALGFWGMVAALLVLAWVPRRAASSVRS
jgi:O-antigen ligase